MKYLSRWYENLKRSKPQEGKSKTKTSVKLKKHLDERFSSEIKRTLFEGHISSFINKNPNLKSTFGTLKNCMPYVSSKKNLNIILRIFLRC